MQDTEMSRIQNMLPTSDSGAETAPTPSVMAMNDEARSEANEDAMIDNVLLPCVTILLCPLVVPCSVQMVREKQEMVLMRCGKYKGTITEPGCHYVNCCGLEPQLVSVAVCSMDLPTNKMSDGNGNPLMVSGVLTYKLRDSYKATIETENYQGYLMSQAQAVLKQVVSKYPYESIDENADSLKKEAGEISNHLVSLLQEKVNRAGIKIESFSFNELSYAPEVAAAMLKKQQAEAVVAARKKIVEGAVTTAHHAITSMESISGKKFKVENKEKLVANLLTVLCKEGEN